MRNSLAPIAFALTLSGAVSAETRQQAECFDKARAAIAKIEQQLRQGHNSAEGERLNRIKREHQAIWEECRTNPAAWKKLRS